MRLKPCVSIGSLIALLTIILVPALVHAGTLYVGAGEPYLTIQAAINAAGDGDTVIVRDGTYTENIDFKGKPITVRSDRGPQACVILGRVSFQQGEAKDSVISGFTIKEGDGNGIECWSSSPTITHCIVTGQHGVGIYCDSSSPIITHCTIAAQTATETGPVPVGIYCKSSSPTITRCRIAGQQGDGIFCYSSSPLFTYCTITGQAASGFYCYDSPLTITHCTIAGQEWDGIYFHDCPSATMTNCTISDQKLDGISCLSSSVTITNCTITNNTGKWAGIRCYYNKYSPIISSLRITNTIIWAPDAVRAINVADDTLTPIVTYSCISGGWEGEGNISAFPLFFNLRAGILQLKPASPCIKAGNPDAAGLPATDMDGNPRVRGGRVDMGAYEFCPNCPPTLAVAAVDKQASEEGFDVARFRVYRVNGDVTVPVQVHYLLGGTATNGEDYAALSGVVKMFAGKRAATIWISPTEDALDEGSEETVKVRLLEGTGYRLSSPHKASARLIDND